ncbi:hypothetical protein S83_052160 [Arachis hypogaea]
MRQRHMWWWCRTEAGTTPPPWRRCEAMKASEKKSLKRTELERLEQIVELYLQQRNLHSLNIYGRHLTTQGIDDILYAYSSGLSAKIARNIIGTRFLILEVFIHGLQASQGSGGGDLLPLGTS